jgi:ribonuclease HI
MIEVYADGSSSGGSSKPGGWGWVIVHNGSVKACAYGGSAATTNNLMEMEGAIQGLLAVKQLAIPEQTVTLISDSQYALGIANGSMSPSKNVTEATLLRKLFAEIGTSTRWVGGHQFKKSRHWSEFPQDVLLNERCDQLAKLGRSIFKK